MGDIRRRSRNTLGKGFDKSARHCRIVASAAKQSLTPISMDAVKTAALLLFSIDGATVITRPLC
jgi:hypothetical protein